MARVLVNRDQVVQGWSVIAAAVTVGPSAVLVLQRVPDGFWPDLLTLLVILAMVCAAPWGWVTSRAVVVAPRRYLELENYLRLRRRYPAQDIDSIVLKPGHWYDENTGEVTGTEWIVHARTKRGKDVRLNTTDGERVAGLLGVRFREL